MVMLPIIVPYNLVVVVVGCGNDRFGGTGSVYRINERPSSKGLGKGEHGGPYKVEVSSSRGGW